MRRIITAMVLIVAVSSLALTQWQFSRAFLPTSLKYGGNGIHGVAVDGAGKIWVIPYSATDSVFTAGGVKVSVRAIYVFNPDGTSVDTIKTIAYGSTRDTLRNASVGLASDYSGNIYYCNREFLYKINYTTRQGVWRLQPVAGTNALTQVAIDGAGEIFTANVLPGISPINIFQSNGSTLIGTVDTAKTVGYSRAFAVSKDGNDVYWAGYTNNGIWKYHSVNGSLGPYGNAAGKAYVPDTIMRGMVTESFAWNPKNGYLWVSSGYNTLIPTAPWIGTSWYAYNPATDKVVDGFTWQPVPPASRVDARPRGIAFSKGGDTAYVACFNIDSSAIQMWTRIPTSVEEVATKGVPTGYALEQNFPNPFNPSTEIQFTIAKAGFAQVYVVDMLGRDVATLVHQDMQAGTYKVRFDASKLPSGTYIYALRSGDVVVSKKMMLLK